MRRWQPQGWLGNVLAKETDRRKCGRGLTCPLERQLAHVSRQLPHAHGLGVSLDVGDGVPTARPVTGDEVRVGGLDFHHACRIALRACGDKGRRAAVSPGASCREDSALLHSTDVI